MALAGCSGSSGGSGPVPAVKAAAAPFTLAEAARGTLQLALDAVRLDEFYARFLRPGTGSVLTPPGPQTAPHCSASGTAASSTGTVQTTVFYPAGDATCHESPLRVLVVTFAAGSSGGPATAYGYQLTYAPAGDPSVAAGGLAEVEEFRAAIYSEADGSAAMDISDSQTPALSGFPATAPAAGAFPATFPVGLPRPVLQLEATNATFAVRETSGSSSFAGTLALGSSFVNPFAVVNSLQSVGVNANDVFAVRASAPDARGNVSISWSATAPVFAIDPLPDAPPYSYSFPLGEGVLAWPLPQLGSLGIASTAQNFSGAVAGSATFAAGGALTACAHTVTDTGDGVSARATCTPDGKSIDLTVTDLHASKPATSPGTIVIDQSGNGPDVGTATALSYTVLFDGSQDQIAAFSIEPAL
jgi:hypothetical protein